MKFLQSWNVTIVERSLLAIGNGGERKVLKTQGFAHCTRCGLFKQGCVITKRCSLALFPDCCKRITNNQRL